jgi:hypothetical protein
MPFIDEQEAVCILLPPDVCPTSSAESPRYLSFLRHRGAPPEVFGAGIAFLPHYEVISRVCATRATLTVDGQLRCNGRRVTPEAYLRLWRRALDGAVPIDQVARRRGLRPVAAFDWVHTEVLSQARAYWIEPPYPNFGELLKAHHDRLAITQADGQSMARLEIDLTAHHGARDAWLVEDYLSHRADNAQPAELGIELRSSGPASGARPRGAVAQAVLCNDYRAAPQAAAALQGDLS